MDSQNAGPVSRTIRILSPSELRTSNDQNGLAGYLANSSSDSSSSSTDSNECAVWSSCGFSDRTYRIGRLLGSYPLLSMLIGISIVATGSMGFLNFKMESRPEELWLDHSSSAYHARLTARQFSTNNRIRLTIILHGAPVFENDMLELVYEIDSKVRSFSYRGKSWEDICYRKDSVCQTYSLLSLLPDTKDLDTAKAKLILAATSSFTRRNVATIPPYFLGQDDVIAWNSIGRNASGTRTSRTTRMVYFLRKQERELITTAKPVYVEEVLRDYVQTLFSGRILNITVSVKLSYEDFDSNNVSPILSFEFFPSLLYSCTAVMLTVVVTTGEYSAVRNGFWLSVAAVFGSALAAAFGFGIASAVGMVFSPVHLILVVVILALSLPGFLVLEQELRRVSDSRPSMLHSEKLAATMKNSFGSLLVALISNFLVFAVGIGSRVPLIRSFCVFGVTSAVGIFVIQILFLFGCLSAWQRTYERTKNGWLCWKPKVNAGKADQVGTSWNSLLRSPLGFLGSNLADNVGRLLMLLALLSLTGLSIFYLLSTGVTFDLTRFDQTPEILRNFTQQSKLFEERDNSITCAYLDDIPYFERQNEFRTFHNYLRDHSAVVPGSLSSWFDRFTEWNFDEKNKRVSRINNYEVEKVNFYMELARFVLEKNYQEDVLFIRRVDDQIGVSKSRICFRLVVGLSAENYTSAVANIVNVARDLNLGSVLVDSRMLLEVSVRSVMVGELWLIFAAVFVVLLVIAAMMLQNILTAVIVFVSLALITIQSVGLLALQGLEFDSLVLIQTFAMIALDAQMVHYVAATFSCLPERPKRKRRVKGVLILSGPTVLAMALGGLTVFVPYFDNSVELFRIFFKIAYTSVSVGLFHALIVLPMVLGSIPPNKFHSATLRLKRRNPKSTASDASSKVHYNGGLTVPSVTTEPNDQVRFVARNPLQRSNSARSVHLHSKNLGLRTVLHSLPTPESSVNGEVIVSLDPDGKPRGERDSLDSLEIVDQPDNNYAQIRTVERRSSIRPTTMDEIGNQYAKVRTLERRISASADANEITHF